MGKNEIRIKSRGSNRSGIGASKSKDINFRQQQQNEEIKRNILKSKKRGIFNNDGDFDENNDDISDENSGDEEEGRTSIIQDRKVKTIQSIPAEVPPPSLSIKRKKKKGKKERQQEKKEGKTNKITCNKIDSEINDGIDHLDDESNEKQNNDNQPNEDTQVNNTATTVIATKRKRRKIRSHQKNIRKDKRSKEGKPNELNPNLPGHLYGGRPLTPATRQLLQLKPPKQRNKSIMSLDKSVGEDGFGGVALVKDSVAINGLAVDDWLHNDDDPDKDNTNKNENTKVGEDESLHDKVEDNSLIVSRNGKHKTKKKIVKKKTKKSKYKNLR